MFSRRATRPDHKVHRELPRRVLPHPSPEWWYWPLQLVAAAGIWVHLARRTQRSLKDVRNEKDFCIIWDVTLSLKRCTLSAEHSAELRAFDLLNSGDLPFENAKSRTVFKMRKVRFCFWTDIDVQGSLGLEEINEEKSNLFLNRYWRKGSRGL